MNKTKKSDGNSLKSFMFFMLMLLIAAPAIQSRFRLFPEKPLSGAFIDAGKPSFNDFSRAGWLNGSFQETFNERLEHHIGFRSDLVRLNNQADFLFFRQANAEGVIIGRNNELFEEDYLREVTGLYYVGDSVWIKKARQLRAVQDTLASLGKTLVVILEPGKGSFHTDLWPRKYRNLPEKTSNYRMLLTRLEASGVNVLDLNRYFIDIKEKAANPLFPKCGTHWSYYGAALAADTTLKYLREISGKPVPELIIRKTVELDTIRHPDYDIGLAMNLLFRIPQPGLVYPVLEFAGTGSETKPNALIVGDSFYFNWLNDHITPSAFSNCDFWYYNKNITRCDYLQDGVAADRNFRDEIMQRDFILIMITERFHHAFAWNFDEQLYDLFYPGYRDPVEIFSNQIRTYGDGFKRMYEESLALNMSLEERIKKEANYLFFEDHLNAPEKYSDKRDLVRLLEMGIRGTPDWMKEIKRKARENGISEDEQIRRDATWMYEDKYGKK
ncbi:SGNH hydrolase-like domain, acetyltransferase AlgX [anaerobic digester metagenome]